MATEDVVVTVHMKDRSEVFVVLNAPDPNEVMHRKPNASANDIYTLCMADLDIQEKRQFPRPWDNQEVLLKAIKTRNVDLLERETNKAKTARTKWQKSYVSVLLPLKVIASIEEHEVPVYAYAYDRKEGIRVQVDTGKTRTEKVIVWNYKLVYENHELKREHNPDMELYQTVTSDEYEAILDGRERPKKKRYYKKKTPKKRNKYSKLAASSDKSKQEVKNIIEDLLKGIGNTEELEE